jgi:hypothetical protein
VYSFWMASFEDLNPDILSLVLRASPGKVPYGLLRTPERQTSSCQESWMPTGPCYCGFQIHNQFHFPYVIVHEWSTRARQHGDRVYISPTHGAPVYSRTANQNSTMQYHYTVLYIWGTTCRVHACQSSRCESHEGGP